MIQPISEQEQQIIQLAALTYQSNETQSVQHAVTELRCFLIRNYPKSFTKIQDLITKRDQIELNIRKALISLLKMTALQLKQLLEKQLNKNEQILNQNKQLLHIIQHSIDNKKIQPELKQPLIFTYIHLFSFYNPDNYERIISKSRYYFNTKQDILALQILQIYHESSASYKCKYQFYTKVLPMLVDHLQDKLTNILNNQNYNNSKTLAHLNCLTALLAKIWISLNFQRYESIFTTLFKHSKLITIFQIFLYKTFPQHLQIYADQITEHIIHSLKRSKLHNHFPELTRLLHQWFLKNKQSFLVYQNSHHANQDIQKYPISKLKLLIAGINTNHQNCNLAYHQFNAFQLFSTFIFPNFKAYQSYFRQNKDNYQQIFNFLKDASFQMKSQCPEILVHKILIHLCKNSKEILIQLKNIIYSFLFGYLVQISKGQVLPIKINFNYSTAIDFWANISDRIPQQQLINSILLLIGLSITLFLNDIQFLTDLNLFAGLNHSFLLNKNESITFYSLLIYRNYRDDIFHNNHSSYFQFGLINKALETSHNHLLTKFSLQILKEQFQDKPTYQLVQQQIKHIMRVTYQHLDRYFDTLINTILINYHHKIENELVVLFTKKIIENLMAFNEEIQFHQKLQKYLPVISTIIQHPSLSQTIYNIAVTPLIHLIKKLPNKNLIQGRQILQLTIHTLQYSHLSETILQILLQFKWQFDNIQIINHFTQLIRKINNPYFINWLTKLLTQQFNIFTAVLLHNIIYYQHQHLNPNILELLISKIYIYFSTNKQPHDYLMGKLAIIYQLLLRFKATLIHQILLHQKWSTLQRQTKEQYSLLTIFQANQPQHLPFIHEYYRMVYQQQHIYRWKYDIQIFIINQMALLKNNLFNPLQVQYANVSLVACLSNAIRAFQYLQSQQQEQDESQDEQIYLKNKMDEQNDYHIKLLQKLNYPEQYHQDFFVLLRNLIQWLKSTNQSNQWLQTIIKKVFPSQDYLTLREILHMQFCQNNKIRRIYKIKQ